jgi:type VI secretion system secreted protein VgrG
MLKNLDPSKFPLRIEGECTGKKLLPVVARVHERISSIPTIEIDFFCENGKLALEDLVGKTMHLVADSDDKGTKRWFRGTCISAEYIGKLTVGGHFKAIVRPWLWYLTRRTDLRIFQNKKVIDIIKEVMGEYGFSGDLDDQLSGAYEEREYCVQYRETDFDFISRLMEEEGIYYYFSHVSDTEKMVLVDGSKDHPTIPEPSNLDFLRYAMRSTIETVDPLVFEWNGIESARSGKVTLEDYNFDTSKANMSATSIVPAGSYSKEADNLYDYPGHYRDAGLGEKRAKVRMQAEAIQHHIVSGLSDGINLSVGHTMKVSKLERTKDPAEVLLIECNHDIVQLDGIVQGLFKDDVDALATAGVDENISEPHMVRFRAVDKSKQYRAPLVTPWPKVGGIHTAVVTGPSGEEIFTDPYGRIKVQFHWDLDGQNDDKTTCFVRTMMPWTGKNWGAIAIPRIGQEVVIDFEEGDPDRPLCVGMLYNDKTMPPYKLPDNKTQSGVKTNSTLGGGGFNELMFEDKKGEELVRFQSEKDYKQIVKNNASIEIGLEKKDKGDLSLIVHNDVDEVIKEGHYSEIVEKGDHKTVISKGDHKTEVSKGDMNVDVKAGKILVKAAKSIELKCGGSSIKLDPKSITIKSTMISVNGKAKVDVSGGMTTVKAKTFLILQGKLTKIN